MKLGFSLAIPNEKFCNEILPMIRDAGFDGFEPTLTPKDGLPNLAEPEASAERLRVKAEKLRLEIPSMRGGPTFWPLFASPNKDDRDRAIAAADEALKAVKIMGGSAMLVVPGQIKESRDYLAATGWATESAKRLAPLAERLSILACIENVENGLFISPLDMRNLIDAVASPWVKSYFDVGNCLCMGQGFPEDWIRILGQRIGRIHFKDAVPHKEIAYLLQGEVNWPAVVKAMRDIGYDQYVCVELSPYKLLPHRMLEETCKTARAILAM
jgi:hexulose-6-phosphate isomerase